MTVVLDGGLSTALTEAGFDLRHSLWTARLLRDHPEAIIAAHRAFIDAGAEIIITSSYQAAEQGFIDDGATPAEARHLLQSTTALARAAVGDRRVLVAASVGPYGAVFADGSEYRGDYGIDAYALMSFHLQRLQVLDETDPDWWACETIPTATEAIAIGRALQTLPPRPTWMTFTCRSGSHTFGGDRIEYAVQAAIDTLPLSAVGVNCTAPQHVPALLRRVRTVTDLPLVAYPNSGQMWDPVRKVLTADPQPLDAGALIDAGAEFIGGCCGIGPSTIAHLAAYSRR